MIKQSMGQFPEARLKPGPPFNHCMIDLLGPFPVRGEVQKRTTGKCYFVLFTDMTSRAVHIECVFGYDTSHFLLAFSSFVHIRGWPTVIYSDPGSQLVGAERELQQAWNEMDNERLIKEGGQSGTRWIFGPADSPFAPGCCGVTCQNCQEMYQVCCAWSALVGCWISCCVLWNRKYDEWASFRAQHICRFWCQSANTKLIATRKSKS